MREDKYNKKIMIFAKIAYINKKKIKKLGIWHCYKNRFSRKAKSFFLPNQNASHI